MATATITPTVMAVEDSQIHRAWMWKRELLRKASKGFADGSTYVRVTFTRLANTTAGAVLIAGTQIGLATRVGWNAAARVATKGVGLLAKGVVKIAQGLSWVVDKIGRGLSWFAGLFGKKFGSDMANTNARFTAWRSASLARIAGSIDEKVIVAQAAITNATTSTFGRVFAGVAGVAGLANIATKGAVAAKVSTVVGAKAALLLGPVGLLATGAIALLGGLFAWLFRKEEVMERAYDIYTEAEEKKVAKAVISEAVIAPTAIENLTVDLTADGGAVISGDADAVAAVMADPEAQRQVLRNAKEAQIKARPNGKPDPSLVTPAAVAEALRLEGTATANADGTFSKTQSDRMRKLLQNGQRPLPVAEPISA